MAERSASRFAADVVQFSDPATGMDFQKKGGYARYVSPQSEFYAPEHLSNPIGDYFWIGVTFAGLAYNTDKVKPEDAPKEWKDILKPMWLNGASVKQANSGTQFVQWYELKRLYGDKFWPEFAKLRPRGFDSRAQQFERLAKGDDKLCVLAEYAGYSTGQGQGRAGGIRCSRRWTAGRPARVRHRRQGAPSRGCEIVHRLADVAARSVRAAEQSAALLRLGTQGCAGDAGAASGSPTSSCSCPPT